MFIAVAEEDHLPEYLYPYRMAPLSGEVLRTGDLTVNDLAALWLAIRPDDAGGDGMRLARSHCGTGFDHDAVDDVPQLLPEFVAALANLGDADRWRVAQAWTARRVGKRPNAEQLAQDKKRLKPFCEYAARAAANRWLVMFLPDGFWKNGFPRAGDAEPRG